MKKNKRNWIKHILAAVLFCMVMSIGMVSLADVQGTVIAKSAVIRASADPQSQKLASVPSGKTIDIISQTKGTDDMYWYQVYVDSSTKGYIRGDLIKVPDGVTIPTTQAGSGSAAQSSDAPPTTANPVDARQVTVISNNTNIREGASTTSASKAKANRGMVLTVIGEADGADGKKWYQVSFNYNNNEVTGFIRSDLVTADNVPADTATSEITGEENPGEEQPPETIPETEQPPEQPEEAAQPSSNNVITPMNVDEVPPYIMAGFEPLTFTLTSDSDENKQEYKGYANGSFLICYARKSDGEEGWFLIDQEKHVFQRYVYTTDGSEVPSGIESIGLIPVIVMVVIIIILAAAVGLLLIKLKGQGTSHRRYRGYDDDDDYQDDDDIEDLEDMEDEEDEPQPIRRPQSQQPARRPQGAQPPVRRPQGGSPNGSAPQGQPARRPQGQGGQQPGRRPQGNPSGGNVSQGAQPPRRPQGQGGASSNNGARPQPPRHPQGSAGQQPPRRPQAQNERIPSEKGQMQKGYKAKNFLEDDGLDIEELE